VFRAEIGWSFHLADELDEEGEYRVTETVSCGLAVLAMTYLVMARILVELLDEEGEHVTVTGRRGVAEITMLPRVIRLSVLICT
jgi:hypothetical protein